MVQAVEVDRKVHRDCHVFIDGGKYQVGTGLAGTTVTMRLAGHLMQAIADGALAGTWPCPITNRRVRRAAGRRPRHRNAAAPAAASVAGHSPRRAGQTWRVPTGGFVSAGRVLLRGGTQPEYLGQRVHRRHGHPRVRVRVDSQPKDPDVVARTQFGSGLWRLDEQL